MFRETLIISSLISPNIDEKIFEKTFYLDGDYSIVAQEYMEQINPVPKNPSDILYDIIAEELLKQ